MKRSETQMFLYCAHYTKIIVPKNPKNVKKIYIIIPTDSCLPVFDRNKVDFLVGAVVE